ncbi:MAG: cobalamin-dependent protein [Planctomycetota bacterium]
MHSPDFTATLLRTSAPGLSGLTAERLFQESGLALVDDFTAWKSHFQAQILQLAAALQAKSRESFCDHVRWIRQGFAARGITPDVIGCALQALRAELADRLPEHAANTAGDYIDAALAGLSLEPEDEGRLDQSRALDGMALSYLASLRAGNEEEAARLVLAPQESGELDALTLIDQLLIPAMREMGRLWHAGEASVAEEHFVTLATGKILTRLIAAAPRSAPNGRTAMLTAVAGDQHTFPLQTIAAHFELNGWRTLGLGGDVPALDLAQAAQYFGAHIVLLGASLDTQLPAVAEAIAALRRLAPHSRILVGGQAFRHGDVWDRFGADGVAFSGAQALEIAEAWTQSPGR